MLFSGELRAILHRRIQHATASKLQPLAMQCIRPHHPRKTCRQRKKRKPMAEELPFKKTMIFTYGVPRELAPGVVRIVANNPSHFTFKGTNTYLVGTGQSVALIDPGPEAPRI
jgi:hypothetical protein